MLANLTKFLVGFFLGVSILVASGAAAAYYFFTKLSVIPPKPVFAEENQQPSPEQTTAAAPAAETNSQPSPSPTPSPTPTLEPGAYRARVTWPEGLSLRDSPSLDANRIGGVAFNREIVILKESDDQRWQQIRFPNSSEPQGWVKAGNVERVND